MEGGIASSDRIEFSKTRLERLGFFQTVNVETVPVPGADDLVDVNYSVEEQPTGSLCFRWLLSGFGCYSRCQRLRK